jgi:predicted secreted protein
VSSPPGEFLKMSLPIAVGLYFICWWMVFFTMLPIGNRVPRGQEPGHAESAPENPRLWWKALITTIVSAVLMAIIYLVIAYRLIPIDIFPMSL